MPDEQYIAVRIGTSADTSGFSQTIQASKEMLSAIQSGTQAEKEHVAAIDAAAASENKLISTIAEGVKKLQQEAAASREGAAAAREHAGAILSMLHAIE